MGGISVDDSGAGGLEASAAEVRARCRRGELEGPTAGLAPGFEQANLVVLPAADAEAFNIFCARNPRPCPLLAITPAGNPEPRDVAPGADLRTDLPCYRVFRNGQLVDEPKTIHDLWRDDLVAFLLGCSFSFEARLQDAGLPVRHLEEGCNVPMYRTAIECEPAEPFRGPLVVSMRPLPEDQVDEASRLTASIPRAHGAPIHVGDPTALGIANLARPDFGDAVTIRDGEVPVFWACGVTPQVALAAARPELAMTHAPGCMFITDLRIEETS